jgi:hypothetical protein
VLHFRGSFPFAEWEETPQSASIFNAASWKKVRSFFCHFSKIMLATDKKRG